MSAVDRNISFAEIDRNAVDILPYIPVEPVGTGQTEIIIQIFHMASVHDPLFLGTGIIPSSVQDQVSAVNVKIVPVHLIAAMDLGKAMPFGCIKHPSAEIQFPVSLLTGVIDGKTASASDPEHIKLCTDPGICGIREVDIHLKLVPVQIKGLFTGSQLGKKFPGTVFISHRRIPIQLDVHVSVLHQGFSDFFRIMRHQLLRCCFDDPSPCREETQHKCKHQQDAHPPFHPLHPIHLLPPFRTFPFQIHIAC